MEKEMEIENGKGEASYDQTCSTIMRKWNLVPRTQTDIESSKKCQRHVWMQR